MLNSCQWRLSSSSTTLIKVVGKVLSPWISSTKASRKPSTVPVLVLMKVFQVLLTAVPENLLILFRSRTFSTLDF